MCGVWVQCHTSILCIPHLVHTHTHTLTQEEDVEHMTMNFIAHSSNRVSRHLVMEFLTWLLLRHREPRIVQVGYYLYMPPYHGRHMGKEISELQWENR